MRGSITKVERADFISALTDLESVVRPMTITVSGAKSLAIGVAVRNKLAWALAFANVSGSSLITGQPSESINALTAATSSPPRSCPITNKPRVDLVARVPAFLRSKTFGGFTFKPSSHASLLSPRSGSSNCTLICTGPVCSALSGSSSG